MLHHRGEWIPGFLHFIDLLFMAIMDAITELGELLQNLTHLFRY
jgi:hypothetical protein